MSNDLISVCVPCYNHEKYVEETILSIVSQTYRNLEIIIIDDCSMDQSYDIILSLKVSTERPSFSSEYSKYKSH